MTARFDPPPRVDRGGLLAAIASYALWGVFPLYWYLVREVPSLQIVAHRVVWCALFVVAWLMLREGGGWLRRALAGRRVLPMLTLSALLISANWGIYIWAVTHGRVVDSSLGYFINPLVSVLLGVVVLRERLNRVQWTAVALAAAGVSWLAIMHGEVPWIALALASSFAVYGLIRKVAAVDAVPGLAIESLIVFVPALAYLVFCQAQGSAAFLHGTGLRDGLLVFGGALTALPLVGFAYGARKIPYSLVGLLQYISPTLQLIVGVVLLGEAFQARQAIGFACIWTALAVYALDGWRGARANARAAAQARCDENVPCTDGATPPR